ncbi:1899_t:CDS:2 [Diversispora eburnea]|uniref:1899_t:CDS:1 n=1 Tax=Diversispora eburnea TaxID=1213867 RepID=A0A9N8VFW0_9GLOM|nr:1899_t:CDS:2 [Diversispora eburnea]
MPPKYQNRKVIHKLPSDDSGNNSPDQEGDDFVQIFAAFHNQMEKKVKDKQKKLATECDKTIQHILDLSNELVSRQRQEIDEKANEYKSKLEELEEDRLAIIKKLRSEEIKYLQLHNSVINEFENIEMAQLETIQKFEKNYFRKCFMKNPFVENN